MSLNVYNKIREAFETELNQLGDTWRILRKDTIVDLVKLSFYNYQSRGHEKYLIDIINYCIKIRMLGFLKELDVTGSGEDVFNRFNKEDSFILLHFDMIYHELNPRFEECMNATIYDLSQKISYLKVIKDIRVSDYSDEVFNEIICVSCNLMAE